MSENYDIVERLWTTANVKINIIKLSAEVISEKLSILSDGSGTITSGEYDLFILNNSVVNVPSIFKVLDQHSEDNDKVAVMAKEIRSIILEVNPLFDPELLVISTENRIKIPDQKDKPGDVRALTANPMWGKVKVDREDDAPSFGDFFPVGFSTMGKRFMSNDKFVTHVIEELDRTIDIIEHNPDSIPEIFKDKFTFEPDEKYSAEIKYKMYVLTKCLDDFTRLFFDLDKEGATEHFGEEELVDILYKACVAHNPFLDYDDIDLDKVKRVVLKMFGENTKASKFSKTATKGKPQVGKDFVDVSEEDILSLGDRMKSKVIGQDDIIDSLCEVIQVSSCGLKEKDQPVGSFMFNGSTGVGKCHGRGTKIRMFDGSVKVVENIVVGDLLMGDNGSPRKVLSLARGQDRMFRVSPTRGETFTCNLAHILTLKDNTTGEIVDIPIDQYLNSSATFKRRKRLFRVPVDYKNIDVSADPYLIGMSIGDDALYDDLSFIPTLYMFNSRSVRLSFISGLLDSSGCGVDGNVFVINAASQDLAMDIVSLCLSVGIYASRKVKADASDKHFVVTVYNTAPDMKLKVKADVVAQMSSQFTNSTDFSMMNFSVDEIDVNDYFGFTLDGNGRYLLHDYIVTHNTHCARVLAEELCGSEDNLIRIDCSEYSQPHEVSKLIGCFTPETTVTMEGGLAKPIKNIVVGDKVISKDGRVKEVKDTFKYEYDGVLYNIRVANDNRIIKCTPKHEFLVVKTKKCWYKNREYVTCKPTCGRNASEYPCSNKLYKSYLPEWVQARDIRAGDLVLQARYKDNRNYPLVLDLLDFYPDGVYNDEYIWCKKEGGSNKVKRFIQVNKDFVRMAGYYVAEGGASKKRVDISFHYDEISYQNEVVNLIRNIFGKEIHFSRCPSEEKIGHKRKRSYVGSKIVASLFSTLFGHSGAENKKLPIWWLDLPNDLLKEFLTTAILGDGCTTISRRVDYCTVSLNLATQIRNIITKLGYISYLCERPPTKKSKLISYKVYVGGKQLSRFSNDLPDLDIKFGEIRNGSKGVVENSNIQRMSYIDCDYIYKQINSISTEKYKGYVHDISVDDTLSYQVYDIIVHNSPAGYVGHDEGGYLTNAIMKKPFSVVLFDEIEKAHQKLHNILLQIFDAGRVTSGKGETVSFEDAVIILTSNVGVKEVEDVKKRIGFGDVAVLTKEKNDKAVSEGLKNAFNPEFLNRIDVIKTFNNLSKEDCLKIVVLAFDKLNKWLSKNNVVVHYNDDVLEYVYNKGFKPGFGARPLKRTMKKEVFLPISKLMLDNKARSNCSITAKVSNGVLVFKHKPLKRRVASEKKEG